MTNADDILFCSTDSGLSVRGSCWQALGVALSQQASCAYWVAHREERAARRKNPALAPWIR